MADNVLSPELAAYIPRFVQIESGGNPDAQTGSYRGLLQMGPDEIAKYGGSGLEQGAQLLADRAAELARNIGRPPTPTELYLAHQQGMGGVQAHMAQPDAPAWQNMLSTGEGQRKGTGWAKQAIWGNIPDQYKSQFGSVDNVTSQQFMDMWRNKVERTPQQAISTAPPSVTTQSNRTAAQPFSLGDATASAQPGLPAFPWSPTNAAPVARAAPQSPQQQHEEALAEQELQAQIMQPVPLRQYEPPPQFKPRSFQQTPARSPGFRFYKG